MLDFLGSRGSFTGSDNFEYVAKVASRGVFPQALGAPQLGLEMVADLNEGGLSQQAHFRILSTC